MPERGEIVQREKHCFAHLRPRARRERLPGSAPPVEIALEGVAVRRIQLGSLGKDAAPSAILARSLLRLRARPLCPTLALSECADMSLVARLELSP